MSTQLSLEKGPDAPLLHETIGVNLAATVARQGDADALVSRHQNARYTYRELWDETERVARGLLALGISKGDRIGIWSPNCAEWTLVQYATARIGAVLVNVNPAYRPAELSYAMQHAGVRLLVTAERFKTSEYLEIIESVRAELSALERVVTIGAERAAGADDLVWADLIAAAENVAADRVAAAEARLDPDDPINIQYTSGTTGNPKGATLTHNNILNNGLAFASVLRYSSEDRVCIPVPLYHCFGMGLGNLGCSATGSTMVYPAPSFEPLATLQAIADERCTSMYGVPTMWIAMLEHPQFDEFDLTSLRTGVMAGAPCPVEVMKRAVSDMHAREVCIAYGMTETAPASFMTSPDDDLERRVTTVGRLLPNVEGKVIDPATGETVPRGTAGEICTRGYLVMRGYWEDADATAAAVDADGWMHTGDLGVMDAEGFLNIVGRSKDMVIRGGENIYPARSRRRSSSTRRSPARRSSVCPTNAWARSSWRGSSSATAKTSPKTTYALSVASASRTSRCRATGRSSTSSP